MSNSQSRIEFEGSQNGSKTLMSFAVNVRSESPPRPRRMTGSILDRLILCTGAVIFRALNL